MLFIGLVAFGFAVVFPHMAKAMDLRWYITLGIILGEILLMIIAVFLSGWIADLLDRIPDKCPNCRASVVHKGGGFYDFSLIPHFTDIFITIIFVIENVSVFFILRYLLKQ
jgi:hypothetical protein